MEQKTLETLENWTKTDELVYKTPEIKKASLEAAKVDFVETYRKWRAKREPKPTVETEYKKKK